MAFRKEYVRDVIRENLKKFCLTERTKVIQLWSSAKTKLFVQLAKGLKSLSKLA